MAYLLYQQGVFTYYTVSTFWGGRALSQNVDDVGEGRGISTKILILLTMVREGGEELELRVIMKIYIQNDHFN